MSRRVLAVSIAFAVALSYAPAAEATGGTGAVRRPDAQIGLHPRGPFVGKDVYSSSGGTLQTLSTSVMRGHSATFYVRIQNDGNVDASFKVTGNAGADGYRVKYFARSRNVTSQVVTGHFATRTLAPQAHATLKVVVKVGQDSAPHASFGITARARANGLVDSVRAKVTAT